MSGEHFYVSTGCLHGDLVLPDGRDGHGYCQSDTGAVGTKTPARCKFCPAPCRCPCHEGVDMAGTAAPEFREDVNGVWSWQCNGGPGCVGWYRFGWASQEAARAEWDEHVKRDHKEAAR